MISHSLGSNLLIRMDANSPSYELASTPNALRPLILDSATFEELSSGGAVKSQLQGEVKEVRVATYNLLFVTNLCLNIEIDTASS